MPARSGGSENEPSAALQVCVVMKLLRSSAITSAFATGRAALVTLPRIWSAEGRPTSGWAGAATSTAMMAANAAARNRSDILFREKRPARPLQSFPSALAYARTGSRSPALTVTLQRLLVTRGHGGPAADWFLPADTT